MIGKFGTINKHSKLEKIHYGHLKGETIIDYVNSAAIQSNTLGKNRLENFKLQTRIPSSVTDVNWDGYIGKY